MVLNGKWELHLTSGKCVFFSNWLYIKTQSKTLSSRDLAQVVRSWVGVLGGSRFESNWDQKNIKIKITYQKIITIIIK